MKKTTKRFETSNWTRYLLPAMMVLILLALVSTIIFVILFATGMI